MSGEVVEEKFPLSYAPKIGLFVIIETDHERGKEVESLAEIG